MTFHESSQINDRRHRPLSAHDLVTLEPVRPAGYIVSAGGNAHHIVCCIAGRERELDRRGVGRGGCEIIGPERRLGRAFGRVIRYRETNVAPIYGSLRIEKAGPCLRVGRKAGRS